LNLRTSIKFIFYGLELRRGGEERVEEGGRVEK
jgi:hypothetical protein